MVYSCQRRWWWMLSSLMEQEGDIPTISIQMDTHKNDPFYKYNERILRTFSHRLDIKNNIWESSDYGKRGLIRNQNIIKCDPDTDWILFVDADLVFAKNFFSVLRNQLDEFLGVERCLATYRYTMHPEVGDKLIDSEEYVDRPIHNTEGKVSSVPYYWLGRRKRTVGAGYFQMADLKKLRERGLSYVDRSRDRSVFDPKGNKFRTDQIFRKKCGGVLKIDVSNIWHLNHYRRRDPEFDENICR